MTIKHHTLHLIKLVSLTGILLLFVFSGFSFGATEANFPLEITNIKPAGTGEPAIPETNRIFRAYPGIEYNIRAAAIGGVYPYTYELSNKPVGMSIDENTGEITWDNPQSDAGPITLSVTDSEGSTVTADWSIEVTTKGFLFVDNSAAANGDGSLNNPYNSMTNFLTDTLDTGQQSDIVYFRAGTYEMVDHNSSSDHILRIDDNPTNWLNYPGEDVVLQGSDNAGKAYRINPMGETIYFDGIIIKNTIGYAFTLYGAPNYYTIRRCVFDGLVPPDSTNRNYGFIFTSAGGATYYNVIQDNEFKNWYGAAAIGSLYQDKKLLIENNYIHTPKSKPADGPSGIGVTMAFALKSRLDYLTVRGNDVQMGDESSGIFDSSVNNFFNVEYMDLCFNYFNCDPAGNNRTDLMLNSQSSSHGPNIYHNVYRNTVRGHGALFRFSPCDQGPFTLTNNVFIFEKNELERDCVTYDSNLEGTDADNIIDSDGQLTEEYSEYVGTRGHQIQGQETATLSEEEPLPSPDLEIQVSSR
ncbi:hypothetical protein HNR65_003255 [Desulfosalsimonas propionicica]|uniref:Right handed beta helix domain-containing protein n=1 Tax=Desulfosalsimonas propionicica TaxID=332175 RepID=A0A7W0CBX2_9BACT|nr:Ig domain-containing protein [Desulfosalsimonas propionicica]MBA2882900.1 hypothetical protein [Desulfosalsimonas propionicica]